MEELLVKLPANRDRCGSLSLIDARGRRVCGPFPVAARSSDALATAKGNPGRNPVLRFGDTPTGDYVMRRVIRTGRTTRFPAAQFGPHGAVVLEGTSGDAALADANGRFHMIISGGELSPDGELRSTAGSLRLANKDMRVLVASLRKLTNVRCRVVQDPSLKSRLSVFIDPRCQDQDPLDLNTARATPSLSREAMLGGAAGAVLSVAFVGIAPQPARASELPAVHNLRVRPEVRFALPVAAPGHDYVRLAYGPPEDNKASDQLKALQQTGPEYNQHVIDTPQTVAPPVVQPQPSSAPVDPVIRQQQEINAIRAEKPPPNATQDQLNQWQQNQQKQIQDVLSGKSQ